jgi:ATP-dependent Clp protease protease subunit
MSSYTIPNVIAQHPRGERIMDVYSHLLTERIVYLGTAIDPGVANTLIAQLLYLEADNPEQEINLYINCEGGDLPSMLAVYDTMQYIQASVATTCVGQAIGVGAVLLAAGTAGRRALLPHARVVLHQPAARGQGPIPDLILQADEVVRMRADIEGILSVHTGRSVQTLRADTDRDRVLTAQAALEYGIVDQVLGQRFADAGDQAARPSDPVQPRDPVRLRRLRRLRRESEHDRTGCADALPAAQVLGDLLGQLDERGLQRSGQGRDHLTGRLLAPALDLGQVLRRYAGPACGFRELFLVSQA